MYGYSIHWVQGKIIEKLGTSLLLRRAVSGEPMIVAMMRSHEILKINTDTLSKCCSCYGINCRKLMSKNNKIRALMKLPMVSNAINEDALAALEARLKEIEEKRKKKSTEEPKNNEEDEDCCSPWNMDLSTRMHR